MGEGVFLWAWDGTIWRKVLVDANGKLQVDVASGLDVDVNLHGYDGAAWQELLVELAANPNLRVKLYDGANGIDSELISTSDLTAALRGLITNACLRLYYAAGPAYIKWHASISCGDADYGYNTAPVSIRAFNGATYDRLRSYSGGVLKVGRAEVGATLVRLTGAGAVVAGAKKLMWLTVRPSAANWALELTDAVAGGGAVKWDIGGAAVESHHFVFDPPIEFSTGVYLETFTNSTSVMFSYV